MRRLAFFPRLLAARQCAGLVIAWSLASTGYEWQAFAGEAALRPASRLEILPGRIVLRGAQARQQLLVSATGPEQQPLDATQECEFAVRDERIAKVAGGVVSGVADGTTQLVVRRGELTAESPIEVLDAGRYRPIHFEHDLLPLLSKLGCNSGSCHGKASGQNGFKLSVFGFDPLADYSAIVKEGRGRRIFPASPEQSLFVAKPTGQVPHGGGRRIEVGSPEYGASRLRRAVAAAIAHV